MRQQFSFIFSIILRSVIYPADKGVKPLQQIFLEMIDLNIGISQDLHGLGPADYISEYQHRD
jgi:hypothetical protein